MPNSILMTDLFDDDTRALTAIVTVSYTATAAGTITLACSNSVVTPASAAVGAGSGTIPFTLTHRADQLNDTVTATLTVGADSVPDTARRVSFLARVPGSIITENFADGGGVVVAAGAPGTFPAKTYICTIDFPAPGAGLHEVTFIIFRGVGRDLAIDTIKAAEPKDPRFPFHFFCSLPAFAPDPNVPGQRVVIRAYYTFNRKVFSVITFV